MPLFIDIHKHVHGLTKDVVAGAHQKNLAARDQHGVSYLRSWSSVTTGDVFFCLVEAPDRDAAIRVHREAHGAIPDAIIEVHEGS